MIARTVTFFAASLALLATAPTSHADDLVVTQSVSFTSAVDRLTKRVAELEFELETMRSESPAAPVSTTCSGGPSRTCCKKLCYCGCGCDPGFYFGVDAGWTKPRLRSNTGATISRVPNNTGGRDTTAFSFDYDTAFTPRFWAGYTGQCGLGARTSYWQYDESSDRIHIQDLGFNVRDVMGNVIQNVATNNTLTSYQSLKAETFDLEATQHFCALGSRMIISAGGRYSYYAKYTAESVWNQANQPIELGFINDRFEGAGPTLALDVLRPLGGGFSIYGRGRGSVLFGNRTTETANVFLPGRVTNNNRQILDEAVTVLELRVALRYTRGPAFLECGVEGQLWDDVGEGGGGGGFGAFFSSQDAGFQSYFATAGFNY